MKIRTSQAINFAIMLLCFTILNSQKANSQTTDSLSQGFLQFQLIGGLGVYYIGDLTPTSYFRIGADLSLNHSNQSGDSLGYSNYSLSPPNVTSTGQPEHTSNSYSFSLSALHIQKLVTYKQTFTYCGIGPMASYSWNRSTNNITISYSQYSSNSEDENTTKISAVGPFVMVGVRSLLVERVSISAEIGFSALYQWTTQSNSNSFTYNGSSGSSYTNNSYTNNTGGISHLKGWNISLYPIRIGLIIEV